MQTTIYLEFRFSTSGSAYEAFKNMGRPGNIFEGEGLQLAKRLGTGAGNGFSAIPNFKKYALLFVFQSEEKALNFFLHNTALKWYKEASAAFFAAFLHPIRGHGEWDSSQPFNYNPKLLNPDLPVAVITRATIRWKKLVDFWLHVPQVSRFMKSEAAWHQIGIGEYPLFMQATFSIWPNINILREVAYQDTPHAEVVKKTRERKWYKEELFTQFQITDFYGSGIEYSRLKNLIFPHLPERSPDLQN